MVVLNGRYSTAIVPVLSSFRQGLPWWHTVVCESPRAGKLIGDKSYVPQLMP